MIVTLYMLTVQLMCQRSADGALPSPNGASQKDNALGIMHAAVNGRSHASMSPSLSLKFPAPGKKAISDPLIRKASCVFLDLQMEAAAAHVRLFRPTGCEIMDGAFNGVVRRQGSVALSFDADLTLFETAARLYFEDLCQDVPESFRFDEQEPQRATITAPSASLVVSLSTDPFLPFRRDATEAEAAPFRTPGLDLEQRARIALSCWRAAHGERFEAWLNARLRQARVNMRALRVELNAIRKDASRRNQHAHVLKGAHPLVRLWLACERAVAWTGPADHGERAVDRMSPEPLDLAIREARCNRSVAEPRIAKHNVHRARELFFALRCTIVRDPRHFAEGLLDVTLDTGQAISASTREAAEQRRGAAYGFDEIYAHQLSRMKTERNGEEIFSHGYTRPANAFMKAHRRKSTKDSRAVVEHAWGTIDWRLL